jgi:hypothetical protein
MSNVNDPVCGILLQQQIANEHGWIPVFPNELRTMECLVPTSSPLPHSLKGPAVL